MAVRGILTTWKNMKTGRGILTPPEENGSEKGMFDTP